MGKCKCDCGPDKECRKTFRCFLRNIGFFARNSVTTVTQGGSGTNSVLTNATFTSFATQPQIVDPNSGTILINFGTLPNGNLIGGYFVTNTGRKVPFGVPGLAPFISSSNFASLTYFFAYDGVFTAVNTGLGVQLIPQNPGPSEPIVIQYTFQEIVFITTT